MLCLLSAFLVLPLSNLVSASSNCSLVEDISSPAACMSVAVSERRASVVVGKQLCFICHPFPSHLYVSHCGEVSSCRFCVGYQFQHISNPKRQLLLLRTHKDSKVSPFSLFTTGESNQSLLLTTPNMSDKSSYKSPLFDMAFEVGVTQVELQMLDSNGKVVVRLRFFLRGGLKTDDWFSKERLVSAFPWSASFMRQSSFNYFSIEGFDYAKGHLRRFYISRNHGGCEKDKGYIAVSIADYCNYFKVPKPAYFWNPNVDVPWNAGRYREASVFQLIGIFDAKAETKIFTAVSNP